MHVNLPSTLADRALARTLALLAALGLAGCGAKNYEPPAATSPESARAALSAALDAWQAGQTMEQLSARAEPIYVGDEDWRSGASLVEYQIAEPGEQVGLNVVYAVSLDIHQGGKRQRKNVHYRVSTSPVASVKRSDKGE